MSVVVVKVLLKGQISGFTKHVNRQKHTVKLDEGEYISKIILHSDREEMPCSRSFKVSESVVKSWISGEAPEWENSRFWKKMSIQQKIMSYISGFDEGYGVSYEYID